MKLAFHYLALANLLDSVLTFIGLQLHMIEESNVLMKVLYSHSPYLFLSLKLLFSLILYTFLFYKLLPAHALVKTVTYSASFLYTLVLIVHMYWIRLLF